MAGNFIKNDQKLDIKLSAMHLNWNIPAGDEFIPWLKEVKEAGYDGITSFAHWGLDPFISHPGVLKVMLNDYGLELAAVDATLSSNYEQYKPIFEFMQVLNCNILACIDPAGSQKDYAKYGDMLNHVGEMALEYGIYAHYHNHTNSVGETLTDVENLMAELNFNKVSLMLDIGHATKDFIELSYQDRAYHFLEKYWDKIHYVELKDWNEASDLNTPLGEGYTDYSRIFSLMKEKGYAGWITVEQNGNDGWSLNRSPLECAKISREFLRKSLGI